MAAEECPLPCLCLCICLFICICVLCVSDGKDGLRRWQQRNLPSPVCVCHKHPLAGSSQANLSNTFVFAFEALRLPLRFVLTLAFWKAGGAQFAVELDFNKAGRFQIINSVFTPTEAYYDSKNVHKNQ